MKPRKGFAGLVVLFVLLFAAICCSAANMQLYYDGGYHTYTGNIFTLKVNGKKLTPPMPPIVFRDYSLVPARAVFQDGLGAAVNWNGIAKLGKNEPVNLKVIDAICQELHCGVEDVLEIKHQ